MTGQHQHPQHHRANKPSTGGFQLLPFNGGDVDMLHGDGGDNGTQATETPNNLAEPTKELTEFSIDTGIQEFVIKESEYNAGRTVKDPVNSLLYDLTGQVTIIGKPTIRYLQVDSNKTERYLSVKLSDERSKTHLLALAYKNSTTDNDNQATEGTQEEQPQPRFKLYTDTMAAENRGRQVEINSLQPGTTKDKIRGAFTPLGEVEFVDIAHKRYGTMVAATVTFATDRPVKELQEQGTRVMFVGNDSGRITRLGNEEIVFHKDLDRKLTNLPRHATPLTLKSLCNKYGNCSVTIPFNFNMTRRKREAFFSFTSKETFDQLTGKNFSFGNTIMQWVEVGTKLCNECGSPDHLIATCPEVTIWKERAARRVATPRTANAAAPPSTNKNRYNGSVPKGQSVAQPNQIGPAYSTILKQDNAQKTKGTQPNQVSANAANQESIEELKRQIQQQQAMIKSLQERLEIREAAEKREKMEQENTQSKMINMEEKISTIVATAVAEAMTNAMLNIRLETWVALKMLKEDMATETEGTKDETKRRKQPSRGAAAAQQADEEQSRQTPQASSIAESFERYNRELAQYMSRTENTQFPPFLSVPQTIAETGQTSGAHTPSPNHQ